MVDMPVALCGASQRDHRNTSRSFGVSQRLPKPRNAWQRACNTHLADSIRSTAGARLDGKRKTKSTAMHRWHRARQTYEVATTCTFQSTDIQAAMLAPTPQLTSLCHVGVRSAAYGSNCSEPKKAPAGTKRTCRYLQQSNDCRHAAVCGSVVFALLDSPRHSEAGRAETLRVLFVCVCAWLGWWGILECPPAQNLKK